MLIHEVQREHPRKDAKRVGRGGKRGTYSGRGIKGQKARAGHKLRPEMRDIIKKVHKRRGYGKNRARGVNDARQEAAVVNLAALDKHFAEGATVTPNALADKGVLSRRDVRTRPVKILGNGTLFKRLSVSDCRLSTSARQAIEQAGGAISAAE